MTNFSRDTFDRMKQYVGVRLQQGVPILDADWNEQDDIRRFELETFLKWFVGNGVPKGDDGFRISATGVDDDFQVEAGRCLVEGWEVVNEPALTYKTQPLYLDPALAPAWGVEALPDLQPLDPQNDNHPDERTDTVYLDVWERFVDSLEDGDLIDTALGFATSVRVKREWVVRVVEGQDQPPAPEAGHEHYALATLHRTKNQTALAESDLADRRQVGLTFISYCDVEQIVADAFGPGYTLGQDGQPGLKLNLRETLNALLRGTLPGTTPLQLTFDGVENYNPSCVEDREGTLWVFWRSYRSGNADIWYKRYYRDGRGWGPDTQLTTGEANDYDPISVVDPAGDLWVFWYTYRGNNYDLWYDRFVWADQQWQGETQLTTDTASDFYPHALTDANGDLWVFWQSYRDGGEAEVYYKRYSRAGDVWEEAAAVTANSDSDYYPHGLADRNGDIWVFWETYRNGNYQIFSNRFIRVEDAWEGESQLTSDSASDRDPMAVEDDDGNIWLFWETYRNGNYDIYSNRYLRADGLWEGETRLTSHTASDYDPFALKDRHGDIWVFWRSYRSGTSDIWYKRYTRDIGWGPATQLSVGPGQDLHIFALEDSLGDAWVFWINDALEEDLWYRKLITNI